MPGGAVVEVVLGLILIYFMFSLICSGLNEFVAGVFNLRGRFLVKHLERVLGKTITDHLYSHPLVSALNDPSSIPPANTGNTPERKLPSHIPAEAFARGLTSVLARAASDGTELSRPISRIRRRLPIPQTS